MSNKEASFKVELYKIANRLREKLGMQFDKDQEGEIDPSAITEADKMIEKLCEECPSTIQAHLERISELWDEMKELPASDDRDLIAQEIFTLAHEIKDIGTMCGYTLAAHFAESLRDYIALTELSLEAQRVITQAHIDALNVVHKKGMRDADDPAAEELKKMVKVAIDKYK